MDIMFELKKSYQLDVTHNRNADFEWNIFFVAVDVLKTTMVDKLPNDLEGMETSMERLLALIDDVYKYVDDVVVRRNGFYHHYLISKALHLIHDVFFLSGRTCCT